MAEDRSAQDKTESATPRRREKAREEGQVARSVEIASVLVLAMALVGLAATGGQMTGLLSGLLRDSFGNLATTELTVATLDDYLFGVARTTGMILFPFMLIVAVAGLGAHLAQVGVMITLKPLEPKFSRMSPANGLKKIFSKRGAMELAKSLVKLAIVGAIVAWSLFRTADELMPLMTVGVFAGYYSVLAAMFRMAAAGAFALGILAILDFFFQRYDHEQTLKMTKQEVKDEMKQSEGDPQIKAKVRARQQAISRQRMMQDVAKADVVVTNPIHFAVALKYDATRMAAPKVVAKGARLLAARIREAARKAGVPVVENPPLARALYKACPVGGDVPLSLYQAVAELLAFVYRDRTAGAAGGAR